MNINGDALPDYFDVNRDDDPDTDAVEGASAVTTAPSYTDPEGRVNDPLSATIGELLDNNDADTAEVDYRSMRSLSANGLPDHAVGAFPNAHNPNALSEQTISKTFADNPTKTDTATELGGPRAGQGYVLYGIKIDAGTAGSCDDSGNDCSMRNPSGNWHFFDSYLLSIMK